MRAGSQVVNNTSDTTLISHPQNNDMPFFLGKTIQHTNDNVAAIANSFRLKHMALMHETKK